MVQRKGKGLAQAVLVMLVGAGLAGCAGANKDKRFDPSYTTVQGEHDFAMALQKRYLDLATRAYDRGDAAISDFYALRSIMAVEGKLVTPHPATSTDEQAALARMSAAFETGARRHAPEAAARAQSFYDCWVVETGPQGDADQGTACRRAALAAIDRMDPATAVVAVAPAAPRALPLSHPLPAAPAPVAPAPVMPAPVMPAPAPVASIPPAPVVVAPAAPLRAAPRPVPVTQVAPAAAPVTLHQAAPARLTAAPRPAAPQPAAPAPVRSAVTAFPEPAQRIVELPGVPMVTLSQPEPTPRPAAPPAPVMAAPEPVAPMPAPAPDFQPSLPAPALADAPVERDSAMMDAPVQSAMDNADDDFTDDNVVPLYEEPVREARVTIPRLAAPGSDMEAAMVATARAVEIDRAVYFNFDSDEITPEAEDVLIDIAALVSREGVRTILLMGHTDSAGASRYNQLLALRRAQAVRAALEARMDEPVDFEILPVGESALAEETGDNIAEALNRRVEISLR